MKKGPKAALITGAGGKLARLLASALAAEGWDIALAFRRKDRKAGTRAERIRESGVRCECFFCDLEDTAALKTLMKDVTKTFPRLALAINNASVFERAPIETCHPETLDRHMRVNLMAPAEITRLLAARRGGGQVINILDADIVKTGHAYGPYLLSKQALAAFTKTAALEYAPKLRINTIAPGPVAARGKADREYMARLCARLPLGRTAAAADLVRAMLFLAATDTVTGQTLFIDSGAHLLAGKKTSARNQ